MADLSPFYFFLAERLNLIENVYVFLFAFGQKAFEVEVLRNDLFSGW
jgi:hypothetical protein